MYRAQIKDGSCKRSWLVGSLVALLLSCSPAHADVIADWNQIAMDTVFRSSDSFHAKLRAMALVNVAMSEVVNFNEGKHAPRLLVKPTKPLGVSSEAAAAAAAHYVLNQLYPNQSVALAEALARSLAAIPDGVEKVSGHVMGMNLAINVYSILGPETADAIELVRAPSAHEVGERAAVGEIAKF